MNCDGLIANASSSIIHVPENIPMGGYDNRKGRCVGTRDMLYTRALSLSDGKETAVIITNDLLCVDGDMTLKIRNSLRNKFEINEKNVLVCATHTHSGPGVIPWDLTGLGGDNSEENQEIKDKITECIITNAEKSLVNMKPVKIGFGCSECRDVASNRADPSGVTDYSIGVISVMDNLHKPVAVIVNYACHPTVLGAENLYISADYPGVVQSKLTEHFGGEIVPMFINGACGNQSTRFTRKGQGFDEVERMGEILYRKTLAALNSINEFRSDIKIKIISEKVELPKKVFKNLDEALQNLQDAKKRMEKAIDGKLSPGEIRLAITRYQGSYITLKVMDVIKNIQRLEAEIQLIKLGDIEITAVPVELFSDYGLMIKGKSSFKKVIIAGYANNLLGYVYTEDSALKGGYEIFASPFSPEAGNLIVKKVLELEKSLA